MSDDFIMRNKIDTRFKRCDFETDRGFEVFNEFKNFHDYLKMMMNPCPKVHNSVENFLYRKQLSSSTYQS